jgi:hypothetical protein
MFVAVFARRIDVEFVVRVLDRRYAQALRFPSKPLTLGTSAHPPTLSASA